MRKFILSLQSVIRLNWHPKIHQIFAGLSDGRVVAYYDDRRSARGVTQAVTRKVKRARNSEVVREELIIARKHSSIYLYGYELYFLQRSRWQCSNLARQRRRRRRKSHRTSWSDCCVRRSTIQERSSASRRSTRKRDRVSLLQCKDVQLSSAGAQGRITEGAGSYHSWILRNQGLARNRELREDDDVRSSILRHAKVRIMSSNASSLTWTDYRRVRRSRYLQRMSGTKHNRSRFSKSTQKRRRKCRIQMMSCNQRTKRKSLFSSDLFLKFLPL